MKFYCCKSVKVNYKSNTTLIKKQISYPTTMKKQLKTTSIQNQFIQNFTFCHNLIGLKFTHDIIKDVTIN